MADDSGADGISTVAAVQRCRCAAVEFDFFADEFANSTERFHFPIGAHVPDSHGFVLLKLDSHPPATPATDVELEMDLSLIHI